MSGLKGDLVVIDWLIRLRVGDAFEVDAWTGMNEIGRCGCTLTDIKGGYMYYFEDEEFGLKYVFNAGTNKFEC